MLGGGCSEAPGPFPLQVVALPDALLSLSACTEDEEVEGGAERLIRPATVLSEDAMEIMLIIVSRWSPSSWTLGLAFGV